VDEMWKTHRNAVKKYGINAESVEKYGNGVEMILKRCKRDIEELQKMCRNDAKKCRTNVMQKRYRRGAKELRK